MLKRFYLTMAIVGTVIPWLFFTSFIATEGVDLSLFITSLFVNGAAGGFSADILISATVFWVWSYHDAQQNNIQRWWIVVPGTLFVGLSLALPLYFYMRTE